MTDSTSAGDLCRRKHRRHPIDIQAEVIGSNGQRELLSIRDIAYQGLRLQASAKQLAQFLPPSPSDNDTPMRLIVQFQLLDDSGNSHDIKLLATPIHSQQETEGLYQIGLEFEDIVSGIDALSEFLIRCSEQ